MDIPDDRDEDHYVPPWQGERFRDVLFEHHHKMQHDDAPSWPRKGDRA